MNHRRTPAPITGLALALAIVLALGATTACAMPAAEDAPADQALNALYWQAHEALEKSDWSGALEDFAKLEKQMRAKDPKNADTAVYWQAYALVQARRAAEARTTVERLHREYPASRWGKEADALVRQTQSTGTKAESAAAAGDEDLAEAAIEGLMSAPPARALPILKKVLAGSRGVKVKKRALFVLSQIDSPEALDAVVEVARSGDRELRGEAIQMLGVSGHRRAIERLQEIYRANADVDVKRHVLEAYLVADRKDLVLETARGEPDPKLRRKAVETLGAMGAQAELKALYDTTKDDDTREAIVQSLGVAGDVKSLEAIASGNDSEAVRVHAIQAIGVAGGGSALTSIYEKASTPKIRDAALQGFIVCGDGKAVVALYKKARSPDEKKALLRTLTVMGDDDALDVIEEELK